MPGTFQSLNIHADTVSILRKSGIVAPTPIQEQVIPVILAGRDVIAQSQTGTGKTLAYLLPIVQELNAQLKTLQAVILVPTRELAMQIIREIEMLTRGGSIISQPLIGGAAIGRQVDRLRRHPQIVVATPGRLLELIKLRKLTMHHVRTFVIDEVDQVFDLGSADEVEAILKGAMRERQILLFSATISDLIIEASARWMQDPLHIQVDPSQRTAGTLQHLYFVCEERDKLDTIRRLVRLYNPSSAIVFINDIDQISEMIAKLKYIGLSVEALYGQAGKQERAKVLTGFREGKFQLLLATDIAARGLDIEHVSHVINYDLPLDADHYVHRVGRTGRMGRNGTAITIITPQEKFIIDKYSKQLGIDIEPRAMYGGDVIRPTDDAKSENSKISKPPTVKSPVTKLSKSSANSQGANKAKISRSKPSPLKEGTQRKEKGRLAKDSKNKGAPKWLKQKRNNDLK